MHCAEEGGKVTKTPVRDTLDALGKLKGRIKSYETMALE